MKLLALILCCGLGCGCDTRHAPKVSAPRTHWADQTIIGNRPEYALSCDADGRIVGRISAIGPVVFADMPVLRTNGYGGDYTTQLGYSYPNWEQAGAAVAKAVEDTKECERAK